jgi:hypothetical protein
VSERGFAGAGRAGQDQGREAIGLDGASQKFSRREDVFLADELIECARTHPGGEGSGSANRFFVRLVGGFKQVLHDSKIRSARRNASHYFRQD